jgi:hypothetical protein
VRAGWSARRCNAQSRPARVRGQRRGVQGPLTTPGSDGPTSRV